MSGFGNEFASEDPRCPGALPEGQVKLVNIFHCVWRTNYNILKSAELHYQ